MARAAAEGVSRRDLHGSAVGCRPGNQGPEELEGSNLEDDARSVFRAQARWSLADLDRDQPDGRLHSLNLEAVHVLWSDRRENDPAHVPRPLGSGRGPHSDLRQEDVRAACRENGCRRDDPAVALRELHELGRPVWTGHVASLRAGRQAGDRDRAPVVQGRRARRGSVRGLGGHRLRPCGRGRQGGVDRDRPQDAPNRGESSGSPHAKRF